MRSCSITKCENLLKLPETHWDVYFASTFFFLNTLLKFSTFQHTRWKTWADDVFFSLFCGLAAVAQHSGLSIKAKDVDWLSTPPRFSRAIDLRRSTLWAGQMDEWGVQGWSLRIHSKALSILTMLTCRTFTWRGDFLFFFPHALFLTLACGWKWPQSAHWLNLTATFCCFIKAIWILVVSLLSR